MEDLLLLLAVLLSSLLIGLLFKPTWAQQYYEEVKLEEWLIEEICSIEALDLLSPHR